jgi:hypothetical protein
MYREAWERGLKKTYYLRTLNKSGIDNANPERRAPDLAKRETTDAEKWHVLWKPCKMARYATRVSRASLKFSSG